MRRPAASLNPTVSSCGISTTSLARQSQTWLSMPSVEIALRGGERANGSARDGGTQRDARAAIPNSSWSGRMDTV